MPMHHGRGPYFVEFDDGERVHFPTIEAAVSYQQACQVLLKQKQISEADERRDRAHVAPTSPTGRIPT